MNFEALRTAIAQYYGASALVEYRPAFTGPGVPDSIFAGIERYRVHILMPSNERQARSLNSDLVVWHRGEVDESAWTIGLEVEEPRDSRFARLLATAMYDNHAAGVIKSAHVTVRHETPSAVIQITLANDTVINRLYYLTPGGTLDFVAIP